MMAPLQFEHTMRLAKASGPLLYEGADRFDLWRLALSDDDNDKALLETALEEGVSHFVFGLEEEYGASADQSRAIEEAVRKSIFDATALFQNTPDDFVAPAASTRSEFLDGRIRSYVGLGLTEAEARMAVAHKWPEVSA